MGDTWDTVRLPLFVATRSAVVALTYQEMRCQRCGQIRQCAERHDYNVGGPIRLCDDCDNESWAQKDPRR